MRLNDLEFIKLMPSFMRSDETVKALCKSVDDIFRPTAEDLNTLSDWDRIDTMTESELDYLAWECNISWYDKNATIEQKRMLCKNSDKIFMTRATVAAVEEIISIYFTNAKLREYWDANCDPHHFKIECSDVTTYSDNLKLFLNILEKTKRKSQWLDAIILRLTGEGNMYSGVGCVETIHTRFNCTQAFEDYR